MSDTGAARPSLLSWNWALEVRTLLFFMYDDHDHDIASPSVPVSRTSSQHGRPPRLRRVVCQRHMRVAREPVLCAVAIFTTNTTRGVRVMRASGLRFWKWSLSSAPQSEAPGCSCLTVVACPCH
jgi:hypothetical protein